MVADVLATQGASPSAAMVLTPFWWNIPVPAPEGAHWGQATHIYVNKRTIIGSDNGLLPERHQAIIWTNAGTLFTGTLGTNFSEILSKIHIFSFKKMNLKMLSVKWQPFCLCLNVLILKLPWFTIKSPTQSISISNYYVYNMVCQTY